MAQRIARFAAAKMSLGALFLCEQVERRHRCPQPGERRLGCRGWCLGRRVSHVHTPHHARSQTRALQLSAGVTLEEINKRNYYKRLPVYPGDAAGRIRGQICSRFGFDLTLFTKARVRRLPGRQLFAAIGGFSVIFPKRNNHFKHKEKVSPFPSI